MLKQKGFTLVELMISLVLGLIVAAIILNMYIATIRSNAQALETIRLNQELRAVADVMLRDMRRTGYSSEDDVSDNPFAGMTTASTPIAVYDSGAPTVAAATGDCVVFGFEHDSGDNYVVGYRWSTSAASVQMHWNNIASGSVTNQGCPTSDWFSITDDESTEIIANGGFDGVSFATIPSSVASFASASVRSIQFRIYGRSTSDNLIDATIQEEVRIRNDL